MYPVKRDDRPFHSEGRHTNQILFLHWNHCPSDWIRFLGKWLLHNQSSATSKYRHQPISSSESSSAEDECVEELPPSTWNRSCCCWCFDSSDGTNIGWFSSVTTDRPTKIQYDTSSTSKHTAFPLRGHDNSVTRNLTPSDTLLYWIKTHTRCRDSLIHSIQ
jgi:hypothetical protein